MRSDIFEAHRRYLKALDLIKSKYEKRISFLVIEDEIKAIVIFLIDSRTRENHCAVGIDLCYL